MGYKNSLLLVMAGMLLSCSSNNDELSGKKFEGYYETCERITIDFDSDSKVTGQISSTDFVGNFSDYIYGHYKYKAPNIVIVWEKINDDNEKHSQSSLAKIRINEHNTKQIVHFLKKFLFRTSELRFAVAYRNHFYPHTHLDVDLKLISAIRMFTWASAST